MSFFINIFNAILYEPLFNLLVLLYKYLPGKDFGIAVIVLTVLIRFFLYPLGVRSIKTQKVINELQPKLQEIQKKYKDNKPEQARLMMELYKKEKINPFSGILLILVQIPILIALYRVFLKVVQPGGIELYSFISQPDPINPIFLGRINLSYPNWLLAICAGIFQFWQTKITMPKTKKIKQGDQFFKFSEIMQKQMLYFFPVFTIFILVKIPSAIALYWAVTTIFSIVQQYFVIREKKL